ncbi:MAG: ABC transporter ATP-binding protein [Acholeplasmatales bacterium]|mgnify:CR=1 FL=1|jgi:ATP-binding cassette subfamily B protein|nr:ABC transporter ATP-binding protein [Acholeplasmatales bacterium]MCI9652905.1 ABC transporter ATP-binding protein [Acholeplasmatales bacterium]
MQKFDDNKNIRTYKDRTVLVRLLKYAKRVRWAFIISLLFTAILVAIDLTPAYLEGELIGVLGNADLTNDYKIKFTIILLSIYGCVIIGAAFLNYFNSMLLQKAGQRIVLEIRKEVFVKIEGLAIAQIYATPVGKLVTRVTSDVNMVNELYTNVIVNLIRYILTILFVFIMMLIISPILTLYILCVIPFLVIMTIVFNKLSRKQYRKVRGCVSNMNAFLSENLSGMKITQIFNQEDKKEKEFLLRNTDLKRNSIREVLIFGVFRPAIYVLYVLCHIILLYNGFYMVLEERLLAKDLVKFYQYNGQFFNPIQQLADQFNQLQSAFASSERIFEILDMKAQILDKEDAIELTQIEGKIEFDHVWFAYNEENWILKDVSFTIYPKQTVAFVGATGAGKTTILALIVRNYEIQKGTIRIDGIDVKDIALESLRKHIGQMLQDVFLFSGTIRSNITLRDDSFTTDEIVEACRYVNASSFIEKLPNGYEYEVLERGNNFSSGQRQLLSFARTILHKPNIMILDEATANIDTETEVLIQDSLEKMMNVGTMLIVAHRLSTVQHADNIIVLHKGKIMESGNHQELLAKKGLYYHLYELQYKHMDS